MYRVTSFAPTRNKFACVELDRVVTGVCAGVILQNVTPNRTDKVTIERRMLDSTFGVIRCSESSRRQQVRPLAKQGDDQFSKQGIRPCKPGTREPARIVFPK